MNIQVDSSGNVTGLDLNAVEQIKRAIDGDISALMKSGDPSELIKDKNALLSAVENLDPNKYGDGVEAFALARKTFKGDSEIADAIDLGTQLMGSNKSAAEFKKKSVKRYDRRGTRCFCCGCNESVNKTLRHIYKSKEKLR